MSSKANTGSFTHKLYSLLEDSQIRHLICWDTTGTYFTIHDPAELSRVVLPLHFKHNNFSSFVRQLNMYGFNKQNVAQSGSENGNSIWEFKHPDFLRGHPEKLDHIKRKHSSKSSNLSSNRVSSSSSMPRIVPKPRVNMYNTTDSDDLMSGNDKDDRIEYLNNKILNLEDKLEKLHESHNLLWSETVACRVLQSKHHQVMQNTISFLSSIYNDDVPTTMTNKKRKLDVDVLQAECSRLADEKSNTSPAAEPHQLKKESSSSSMFNQSLSLNHFASPIGKNSDLTSMKLPINLNTNHGSIFYSPADTGRE